MSEAITALLLHPGKARSMGEAGRQLAMSHDIGNMLDRYELLYTDLARQHTAQRNQEKSRTPRMWKHVRDWIKL